MVNQIVRASDKIKARNGIYFNNDIDEVLAHANGGYSVALPVVLESNFRDIKVSNGVLSCGSKSAGSACTYFLEGKVSSDNTLVAANIDATNYAGAKIRLTSDTMVRQTDNKYAYLLVAQPEDLVADTNGKVNPSVFAVFNSGNDNAAISNITYSQGFEKSNVVNECGDEINSGNSCVIGVKPLNNSEVSLAGSVNINYKADATTNKQITTNFLYLANNLGLGLNIKPVSNQASFKNTLVGISKNIRFKLENTGNKTLNKIAINVAQNGFEIKEADNCSQLAPTKVCEFNVLYKPTESAAVSTTPLSITGVYASTEAGQIGIDKTFYSEYSIEYSAKEAVSAFAITPKKVSLVAKTNDQEVEQKFVVKNVSNYNSVIGKPDFEAPGKKGLTISSEVKDVVLCDDNLMLEPDKECTIPVKFKPENDFNNESQNLLVPVKKIAGVDGTYGNIQALLQLTSSTTANYGPNIQVKIVRKGPNDSDFTEFNNQPYEMLMFGTRKTQVKYTFSNTKPSDDADIGIAANFNIQTSRLNSGIEVDASATNCPIGTNTSNLDVAKSCDLVLNVPKLAYFTNGLLTEAGTLLPIDLEYSYRDPNQNTKFSIKEVDKKQIMISTMWVKNLELKPIVAEQNDGSYLLSVEAKHTGLVDDPVFNTNEPSILLTGSISGLEIDSTSCQLEVNKAETCDMLILPATFPKGEHFLDVDVSFANSDAKFTKTVKFEVK